MSDAAGEIRKQFQRRRIREVLALLVALVAVVFAAEDGYEQPGGPLGSPAGLAALGVVLACFLFHVVNWRCPACRRYLGFFHWGMPSCRWCGTKLAAGADRSR
jgi:hypothetical protein